VINYNGKNIFIPIDDSNHPNNQAYFFFQILYNEVNYSGDNLKKIEKDNLAEKIERKVLYRNNFL
jgi:hypothetical protein